LRVLVITRIIGSLILGVKGSREFFFGNARGDIRGLGLSIERTGVYRQCIECRNTRDVWYLGLGVERNAEGGLRRTSDELGSCLWLWAGSSQGMREPGSLKERDIIGAERKCVPNG
jgi:hypothetical protein